MVECLLLAGRTSNKDEKYHIKDSLLYAWRHLKPLYIVYLLSCYIFLNDNLRMYGINYVKDNILGIIKNIFLVHSWVITGSSKFEISGVSWYLSVMMFLWLLSPIIQRFNRAIQNYVIKGVVFGLIVVLIYLLYDKTNFLSYQSLLLRFFQYYIGMLGRELLSTKIVAQNRNILGMIGLSLLLACFFNLPIGGGNKYFHSIDSIICNLFVYAK